MIDFSAIVPDIDGLVATCMAIETVIAPEHPVDEAPILLATPAVAVAAAVKMGASQKR